MVRWCAAAVAASLLATCLLTAGNAAAQDGVLRPLCPDRPSKGTGPCTVDAGHLQIEADVFAGAWNHQGGSSVDSFTWFNPTLKYGLTDDIDIEINVPPLVSLRQSDTASGTTQRNSGVGDLYLRAKANLTGNRDAGWNVAIEPFLKAPTARAPIGNDAWEGGLLVPLAANLSDRWAIGITPEIDRVENGAGAGGHTAIAGSVGLTRAMGRGVSLTGEVWSAVDFDPAGATRRSSLDFAVAWTSAGHENLQLDTGVNLGLNRNTNDVEAYVGIARRF